MAETESLYPYVGTHLALTKLPKNMREVMKQSSLFYTKDFNEVGEVPLPGGGSRIELDPGSFEDLEQRLDLYSTANEFGIELSFYPLLDILQDRKPCIIPRGTAIELTLSPNLSRRCIIKLEPDSAFEPYVEISVAEISITRILAATQIRSPLSYRFLRVKCSPLIIPPGTTNFRSQVTFSNTTLPARLCLKHIETAAFDGDHRHNLLTSKPYGLSHATFELGSRRFPLYPIEADFAKQRFSDLYLKSCEALRYSLNETGESLGNLQDFGNNNFLMACDTSIDYSAGSPWTVPSPKGTIGLCLKFDQPTPRQIIALVLSEYVACLSITESGVVSVE